MIWLALKIDEYVPDTMPTRSARAKFRIENPPNRYSAKSVRTTVNDVITELERLDASQLGEVPGGSAPNDRYQPFLALGILLLIAEYLISDRRGMPHPWWLRGRCRGWH